MNNSIYGIDNLYSKFLKYSGTDVKTQWYEPTATRQHSFRTTYPVCRPLRATPAVLSGSSAGCSAVVATSVLSYDVGNVARGSVRPRDPPVRTARASPRAPGRSSRSSEDPLMGTLNSAALFGLVLAGPSASVAETLACDAGRVATVQEPSISKLLPAVGCGADSGHRLDRLRDRRLQ